MSQVFKNLLPNTTPFQWKSALYHFTRRTPLSVPDIQVLSHRIHPIAELDLDPRA